MVGLRERIVSFVEHFETAGKYMSTASYDQPITCSPIRALKSFFNSPNWVMNLLWLTLAALLQSFVVGSVFLFGYGTSLLKARAGLPDRDSPDIDSNQLGDYFVQGLWPFLVYLVASIVVSLVTTIPAAIFAGILMMIGAQMGEAGGVLVAILLIPLTVAVSGAIVILLGPITIRAMICQDFQKSFDIGWCVSFIKLTYVEVAISTVLFLVIGMGISLAGFAMFCIGIYPAIGLLSGVFMHLLAQWYELFLSRGGEPVQPPDDQIVDATLV